MGQPDVYQTVGDPSVTVRFPLTSLPAGASPELAGADLLVWTTTPWTLVSNTAVAVHPDETYVVARRAGDGEPGGRRRGADGPGARRGLGGRRPRDRGSSWPGATYRPPFGLVDIPDAHIVVTGDFVTTEDGTGLVHLAPAFGADDMETGRAHGLPVVNPIRPDGRFDESVPHGGRDVLQGRRRAPGRTTWPSAACCSASRSTSTATRTAGAAARRCCTTRCRPGSSGPPRSRTSCWPRTSGPTGSRRRSSTAATASGCATTWTGRCPGPGTGAPRCRCGRAPHDHVTCVGSLAELSRAGRPRPDRPRPAPAVRGRGDDHLPDCGAARAAGARRDRRLVRLGRRCRSPSTARRCATRPSSSSSYPAQFICEAIDQTRGWFYSLMAVGTLVFGRSAYENVVCLGLIVDERGPQDEQAPGQRARADPADGRRTARTRCAGSSPPPARPGRPAGSGTARSRRSSGRCCSPTGTPSRSSCCTRTRPPPRAGADACLAAGAAAGRPAAARPVGAERAERGDRRRHRRAGGLRHRRRRAPARGLHRRPVQLVRAPVAPPVLGRARAPPTARRRSPRC